jgi:hypothetical protein
MSEHDESIDEKNIYNLGGEENSPDTENFSSIKVTVTHKDNSNRTVVNPVKSMSNSNLSESKSTSNTDNNSKEIIIPSAKKSKRSIHLKTDLASSPPVKKSNFMSQFSNISLRLEGSVENGANVSSYSTISAATAASNSNTENLISKSTLGDFLSYSSDNDQSSNNDSDNNLSNFCLNGDMSEILDLTVNDKEFNLNAFV